MFYDLLESTLLTLNTSVPFKCNIKNLFCILIFPHNTLDQHFVDACGGDNADAALWRRESSKCYASSVPHPIRGKGDRGVRPV